MNTRPGVSRGEWGARRGFALLITVTLLAFIVVLLVGLAAYVRVETAVAGNTQRQEQARENALFALNVALGQLQQHAGPDQRVTSTAASFTPAPAAEGEAPGSVNPQKIRYTGVWESETPGAAPRTWLVSGIERGQTENVTAVIPAASRIELVGARTAGAANAVAVAAQDISPSGVPGAPSAGTTRIGRYAWWVGDQGVKAPVAIPDETAGINYAPYDTDGSRARLRQQLSFGAGPANAADGLAIFDAQEAANAPLVAQHKIASFNQLAYLRRSGGGALLGPAGIQPNFDVWSPNNYAVLANSRRGGLRQDLSINPAALGGAFVAWTNYSAYMEPPVAVEAGSESNSEPVPTGPAIVPAYGADPLRRRYRFTPHLVDDEGSHSVGPVLTYFLLSFNVRVPSGGGPGPGVLEVRARAMLSLWNPYTSAIVPQDLRAEISGLPENLNLVNEAPGATPLPPISLTGSFGPTLKMALPWTPGAAASADHSSWLPGRVYTWRTLTDATKAEIPEVGYLTKFDAREFAATDETNEGIRRNVVVGNATNSTVLMNGNSVCHLTIGESQQLTVALYVAGASVPLARFRSPEFAAFSTTPRRIDNDTYQFSYVFRLAESFDTPSAPGTWLQTDGRDIRRRTVPAEAFVVEANGNDPSQYENYADIARPDRLLDRRSDSYSYNEDVPVFELPRSPLLSLGALQHFRIVGRRPFMIGNSWGADATLNEVPLGEIYDRYFLSGLAEGVTPSAGANGDLRLPGPLLKTLRTEAGARTTVDDLRGVADGRSAKFLLQGGAFNLNSTQVAAWAAVLRGVRYPAPAVFEYLDASADTGTAEDATRGTVQSDEARFFRFSQSAQETFKAEPGQANGGAETPSPANTHLFRQGVRTLAPADVVALAQQIVWRVKRRHATEGGPFRSMEDFLGPAALFGGKSLLESAIAGDDASNPTVEINLNASIAEFSSQWLTQGDVMTALAPILFPRSDTFVIRTYGEVRNPATDAVEGRAWCEALVQRVPEYFDPADPAETPVADFALPSDPDNAESTPTAAHQINQVNGRRFKVISFRWLARSDI